MLLRTELTLLLRARMAMFALILVALLSIAAVAAGMAEVCLLYTSDAADE